MSTTIDLSDDDGENLRQGLVTLVVALVEIIDDALEKEAVRRMESGELSDEEINRLGAQLKQLDAELERLKEKEGVDQNVAELRGQLDGLLDAALRQLQQTEETNG
ncbi:MAG: gas vesicle protein K [halophilic archaeon J07HX5]|jgi:Gas vesicle protein K.|nr:MAG: gas vesicle protein K [halophilic archaeon J07HX5]